MISFVIPVRDDADRLRHCLQSIAAAGAQAGEVEVIVADNGSRDDSAVVARAAGATVLELPGVRLGELRNRAAAAARGDVLAFVDADHEIGPDWIPAAIAGLADPAVGALGAPCHPPVPGTWVQQFYDRLRSHPRGVEPVEWLGSGNMAVRRRAFEDAGGFDTTLETCEDVDLCRKLRARGLVLLADPRMHNIHFGDPRTLKHVFFGELWRGRDNVRVSLRPPRAWRTLASAAIPVVNLLALVMVVVGLLSARRAGLLAAAVAAGALAVLVGLRAIRMVRDMGPDLPKALAVASAYEFGRALAVAARFGYGHRRSGATT